MEMVSNSFGFLWSNEEINIDDIIIVKPIRDLEKTKRVIEKHLVEIDGELYLYPPVVKIKRKSIITENESIRGVKPAFLWKIYPSHELYTIKYALGTSSREVKLYEGSLIIYLLSFLFDTRLHFSEWMIDGRVPIRKVDFLKDYSCFKFLTNKKIIENFLYCAYDKWKMCNLKTQKRIINILYMHSRFFVYEWWWEKFMIEYMVFDGLWNIFCKIKKINSRVSHKKRFSVICDELEIIPNEEKFRTLYQRRNELVHEALWRQGMPGGSNGESPEAIILRKLNQRIIAAFFEWKTDFLKSPWWTYSVNHDFGNINNL